MSCAPLSPAVPRRCDSLPHAAQAKEFGEAEVWMNERLMRAAPRQFAEFVTAFEDRDAAPRRAEPLWLVTLKPNSWFVLLQSASCRAPTCTQHTGQCRVNGAAEYMTVCRGCLTIACFSL